MFKKRGAAKKKLKVFQTHLYIVILGFSLVAYVAESNGDVFVKRISSLQVHYPLVPSFKSSLSCVVHKVY